tara:strand:+ start:1330 stop:4530 length:3201 start_codon:yes stop_codon:yes gene_type:complete
MKELTQIYRDAGKQLIEDLFKDYLVVSEKLSGSTFSFKKDGDTIVFYKGGNQRPINLIDRTIMVYYEKPINYIKSITSKKSATLPSDWRFCFQYFVNTNPGLILYDNLPENNLVLTHIKVMSPSGKVTKVIEDPRVIRDWANVLGVTPLLPLFKGYLTEDQKKKIKEFLDTPKEDHAEIFSTNSFAEYLLRILNPNIQSTTLQNDLKKPIESIIFKFYKSGTKQIVAAKLIDPYTINLMKEKVPVDARNAPADINEIILLDLLAFIEERGIKKHEILGDTEDTRYIELVSNIFNDYVTKRGKDIAKIDIEKADFAKGKEFDLNVELIPNQRTRDILNSTPKLKDLFKIILGSLKKKRKNTGNIMTPSVIEDFNKMVDKVTDVIQTKDDGKFKTFDDYLKIKSTNESLLPNAEELLIEDKVLDYNNFINLGKVIVEEKGKTEIINKETGDKYFVKNPNPKKHKIVEPGSKSDKETESGLSDSLNKKFTTARVENIKKDFDRIAFSPAEDREKFEGGFEKVLSGKKLSKDEAEMVGKYAQLSDSKGKLKIYFASNTPGEFRQGGREKVMDLSDKDGAAVKELTNLGLEVTSASTVGGGIKPKIGPKDINPNKISGGKTYKPEVKVKKNDNGEIEEITMGSTKIKRLTKPNQEKLTERLTEAFKLQNPDLNDKEVGRLVKRTNRAIDRHNKNLEKWEKLNDVDMIETVPGLNDLPQNERSEKIQKEYPNVISNKMKEMIGDNPTPKEKEVLASIEKLSDMESVEDFDNASIEILRKMDDIESIRKGSADLAESFVYMSMNKKGYRTELPAGENFPVADVICLGADVDLDPNDPEYASKVAMQGLGLAVNLETMGGISVKKDGGAASALKNKIGESEFYNKETGSRLDSLADNHNNFMGTLSDPTTSDTIKKGNEELDKQEDWAVENGIIDKDKLPLMYGNRSPEQWADDTIKDWEKKGKGPFPPYLKDALTGHCKACLLVAEIHNGDLEEQSYGNVNVSTSKKNGGMDITDGVTNASLMKPSPNPGFSFAKGKGPDGTNIPRPNAVYAANLVHADFDPETNRFKINDKS